MNLTLRKYTQINKELGERGRGKEEKRNVEMLTTYSQRYCCENCCNSDRDDEWVTLWYKMIVFSISSFYIFISFRNCLF